MTFLIKKKIKGNVYLYLARNARINGKTRRIWEKYIGPENNINEQTELLVDPEPSVTTLDFGLPIALMGLVKQLGLVGIINKCTSKRSQGLSVGHYMVLAAINSCVKPTSKARLLRWFEHTALFKEFPPIETYLDSMAYANHFKYLTSEAIKNIEALINKNLIEKFNLSMNSLFYDPKSFFTYINPKEGVEIPKHGHSKEGRSTLNLVGLTLFCTKDGGVPVLHEVYPGNVHNAKIFKEQVSKLFERLKQASVDPREICVVFDKGNLSQEAFEQVYDAGLRFVCSIRPSTQKEFDRLTPSDFSLEKLPNGKEIGVLEFARNVYGQHDRLFVVFNPRMKAWQEKNLLAKLETKIETVRNFFEERLNAKKWRAPEAIEKKIRDVFKTKKHLDLVDYSVSGTLGNVAYTLKINEKALEDRLNTLGKSYFLSNHPEMAPLDVVWLYRQQNTMERAFKYIKSPSLLSARPMYHWTEESIRGHLFTCVLGLLLLTLLTRKVQKEFDHMSLWRIVEVLSEIELVIVQYKGTKKIVKKIVDVSPDARRLLKFLELEAPA
ncbi:MAG: IS1634 family transposase [Candidatus Lokiarchaeota archaeon]|nr:IS1634 family transposase [Candidatus Lokiarchaeota archaeon]